MRGVRPQGLVYVLALVVDNERASPSHRKDRDEPVPSAPAASSHAAFITDSCFSLLLMG